MSDNIKKQVEEIIRKYNLDKKTFTNKKAPSNLHFFFVIGEMPFAPVKNYFKIAHTLTYFDIKDGVVNYCWNNEDLDNLRNMFIKKILINPKEIDNFKKEYNKRVVIFNKKSKKISKKLLSTLPYGGLYNLYEEWYQVYKNFHGFANSIHDAFTMHPEKWIEPELKKYIKNETDYIKIYLTLISQVKESFEIEEYKEKLNLVKFIDNNKFEEKLVAHEKKWHWLRNNYSDCFYLNKEYFRKEIKKLKSIDAKLEIRNIENRFKLIKEDKKRLIKKFKLEKKAKLFIRLTEELGFMQDDRKRYVMPATYFQNLFLQEFSKRLGLEMKEIKHTFIHELKDMENKKIKKSFFTKRKKCTVVINSAKGYEIFFGDLALKIHEKILKKEIKFQKELKGQIASMGYAKGKVKIIITTKDILKVKNGDIIVASMTKPDTLPAMIKAAAIITEEGGITSHAAIVSREMKKPCIIGTKNATKILKNGDIVEVDANKGIIKKI